MLNYHRVQTWWFRTIWHDLGWFRWWNTIWYDLFTNVVAWYHLSELFPKHQEGELSFGDSTWHKQAIELDLTQNFCGWENSCTTLDGGNPINTGMNHWSAGAEFRNHPPYWCNLGITKVSNHQIYVAYSYNGLIMVNNGWYWVIPSGKRLHNHGTSSCLMVSWVHQRTKWPCSSS